MLGIDKKLLMEIFRYGLVGGFAFLVDQGVLILFEEIIFNDVENSIYFSTAIAFTAGLLVNYFLSIVFVFKDVKDKEKGKKFSSFVIFAIIGIIGLGITELGMFVNVELLGFHYVLMKCVMAVIVLAWNYIARKLIIFR